jgi:hypothetical protein
MPSSRGKNAMSDALATVYDWKALEVSEELVTLGSALDKASKLSGALELKEAVVDIRKEYYHALSIQKKDEAEEDVSALSNGEARVSNRAAIASSAADTQGVTGAEKDKMIAEAVSKERAILEEKAKKQEDELQKKLDEAKTQRESAEKNKKEAEDKHKVAVAEAERAEAEMNAELHRTRQASKAEGAAKEKLEAIIANIRRKRDNGEAIDADDFGEAPAAKKRKTAEELKEERLQKLIEKAGDEDEGRRLFEEKEEERQRKAQERTAARIETQRLKLCKDIEEERAALSEQLEKVSEVREAQDEELQLLRDEKSTLEDKLKRAKKRGRAEDDAELDDLNVKLAEEKASSSFWKRFCKDLKKEYNIPDEDFKGIKERIAASMKE